MSEAYDGDDEGWDWWNWENGGGSAPSSTGGGGGSTAPSGGGNPYLGGSGGPLTGGPFAPGGGNGGNGGDGTYTPPSTGGGSSNNWYGTVQGGGGMPEGFFVPPAGSTPFVETPGPSRSGSTTNNNSSSTVNNTQNNTQNNSAGLVNGTVLGAFSPISSGVPTASASSFKPNVISSGGGLHEGAPPPMPAPHAGMPPSLHPEKPTDWSSLTLGGSAPHQSDPYGKPKSTLGRIGDAIGQVTGISQAAQRYKGLYDALSPHKPKTPEEEQADAYRATYGL